MSVCPRTVQGERLRGGLLASEWTRAAGVGRGPPRIHWSVGMRLENQVDFKAKDKPWEAERP